MRNSILLALLLLVVPAALVRAQDFVVCRDLEVCKSDPIQVEDCLYWQSGGSTAICPRSNIERERVLKAEWKPYHPWQHQKYLMVDDLEMPLIRFAYRWKIKR